MINAREITPKNIRFFLGYSGWSGTQLKDELNANSWIISEFNANLLISINQNLWHSVLDEKGGKFKMISNFPQDPSSN